MRKIGSVLCSVNCGVNKFYQSRTLLDINSYHIHISTIKYEWHLGRNVSKRKCSVYFNKTIINQSTWRIEGFRDVRHLGRSKKYATLVVDFMVCLLSCYKLACGRYHVKTGSYPIKFFIHTSTEVCFCSSQHYELLHWMSKHSCNMPSTADENLRLTLGLTFMWTMIK